MDEMPVRLWRGYIYRCPVNKRNKSLIGLRSGFFQSLKAEKIPLFWLFGAIFKLFGVEMADWEGISLTFGLTEGS